MTMLPGHLVDRFNALLERARAAGEPEPTALSLATADETGRPSVRTVLLKQLDRHGFVVYTNTQSDKGRQLAGNPQAAICILWKQLDLGVQVRAEGRVSLVAEAEADAYFASRPRGSQIGAWASAQSRPLADRAELQRCVADAEQRFADQPVPRPPHWSGYRLAPDRLEFWHGRDFRLHDRELFMLQDGQWHGSRLFP